ncbi:MAG: hypothetical protein GY847_30605 [Proteobacteria bacterium]|nr:hypothetical protein [Pseudomonadota bacterium]
MESPFFPLGGLRLAAASAVILAAVIAMTMPGFDGDFLNWDDDRYIIDNPHVESLTLGNLKYAFSGFHFQSYHPLHLVSYMVDGQLWPGRASYYRLHSLLVYLAATGMLFALFYRLGLGIFPAMVGTLFSIMAPYRIESTIWITSRKDVLALFFSLLAWHLHMSCHGNRGRRITMGGLASITLIAALLSKSAAVVVPFMIFAADVGLCRISPRTAILKAIPYLVPAAVIAALVPYLWTISEMTRDSVTAGVAGRIELVGWSITHYLKTALWPFSLAPIYAAPKEEVLRWYAVFGYTFFIAAIAALLIAHRRGRSITVISVAFSWFFIGIAPFLNIIPLYYFVADRYLLFSSLGVALFFAHAARSIYRLGRLDRRLFGCLGLVLILGAWGMASIGECRAWLTSESLWRHCVARQPDAFFARLKLGETLRKGGKPSEAADQYREARKIRPGSRLAIAGVFWSELAVDAPRADLTSNQIKNLVNRFAKLVDDGPGLLGFARELKRHGLERAAHVALDRVRRPLPVKNAKPSSRSP